MYTGAHERDPVPMVDDVDAPRRAGRRLYVIVAVVALAIAAFVACLALTPSLLVPEEDVVAAQACHTFGQQLASGQIAPDTAPVLADAARLTGRWQDLGGDMRAAVALRDTEFTGDTVSDDAKLQTMLTATRKVFDRCREVPDLARLARVL